jgi:hypothetical protein
MSSFAVIVRLNYHSNPYVDMVIDNFAVRCAFICFVYCSLCRCLSASKKRYFCWSLILCVMCHKVFNYFPWFDSCRISVTFVYFDLRFILFVFQNLISRTTLPSPCSTILTKKCFMSKCVHPWLSCVCVCVCACKCVHVCTCMCMTISFVAWINLVHVSLYWERRTRYKVYTCNLEYILAVMFAKLFSLLFVWW